MGWQGLDAVFVARVAAAIFFGVLVFLLQFSEKVLAVLFLALAYSICRTLMDWRTSRLRRRTANR